MSMLKERYQTERLILRIGIRSDARMVLNFYLDNYEDFSKFEILDRQSQLTLKYIRSVIASDMEAFTNTRFFRYYLFDKYNPLMLIGTVSFRDLHFGGHCWCEVGYKIDKNYRCQGYATEALDFLLEEVRRDLSMHRVQATVQRENTASIKLLEKLGFDWEGTMRETAFINGAWRDHQLYAKIF